MAKDRRPPKIDGAVGACDHTLWQRFAPYHYLTADLPRSARTFALYVDDEPVCFLGVLFRPVSRSQRTGQNLMAGSRIVTLPDWQGLGLAFTLAETVAGAYKAIGMRYNHYPAHPAFIRAHDRSPRWAMIGKPGLSATSNRPRGNAARGNKISKQARPCAVFRYVGPALPTDDAHTLLQPYMKARADQQTTASQHTQ